MRLRGSRHVNGRYRLMGRLRLRSSGWTGLIFGGAPACARGFLTSKARYHAAPARTGHTVLNTIRACRWQAALAMSALVLAATISACGSSSTSSTASVSGHVVPTPLEHPTQATLILDFTPNAVHAGIYRAL